MKCNNTQCLNQAKCANLLEEDIKNYISKNLYLLKTDDIYTINCHLKPRLVSSAVEEACSNCRAKGYTKHVNNQDCYKNLFVFGMEFATKYVNLRDERGGY